jgi:hypothetical protein
MYRQINPEISVGTWNRRFAAGIKRQGKTNYKEYIKSTIEFHLTFTILLFTILSNPVFFKNDYPDPIMQSIHQQIITSANHHIITSTHQPSSVLLKSSLINNFTFLILRLSTAIISKI